MQKHFIDFIIGFSSIYLVIGRVSNTQQALLTLFNNWRKGLEDKSFSSAILMDLQKYFDVLNYDLLIAKPHAYRFQCDVLKLLHSYLSIGWYRTKLNTSFSSFEELIKGAHQGSVHPYLTGI